MFCCNHILWFSYETKKENIQISILMPVQIKPMQMLEKITNS